MSSTAADGIATVTFGHPKSNSLPGAILRQLADSISRIAANDETRVIVLKSDGDGPFCAGASFDELRAVADPAMGQHFFSGFANVILAMIRAPQFVIARVQGKTAGGGVGLIAASDYAIASTAASVKLSELAVGIGPFVVGPVIERKIGLGAFSALAIHADWRDAEWARQQGLYAETCESVEHLDESVATRARVLAGSNPLAMREIKKTLWAGTEHWQTLLAERAGISGRLVLSDAAQRAIAGATRRA